MFTDLFFYLFSATLLFAALRVVTSSSMVHSVLWLIAAFFNGAGLFLLLGAEFLAMILVIVYVGAVAVLFLFVVMMLDHPTPRRSSPSYVVTGLLVAGVLTTELILVVIGGESHGLSWSTTNTQDIGAVLYTHYILSFQGAGLILLVAMIGAIALTHRVREGVKRQAVSHEERKIKLKYVDIGEGVQ